MGFFSKLFSKNDATDGYRLYAPLSGRAVDITEVPDPTFAEGLLGTGMAIEPSDGKVYAPCDAKVDTAFETGHAVSLISETGVQILIHVGLDTVTLKGTPFTLHVKNGDTVKKGQLLLEADLDIIRAAGLNPITPVLVCNSDEYSAVHTTAGKTVSNADVVIEVEK